MGVQVTLSELTELERIRERENERIKASIQKILAAGTNVVFTTKSIDETALKYFVEAQVIACRRVPPDDLDRISKATGAEIVHNLADYDGNERFDPEQLGFAEAVYEEQLAENNIIVMKNCKKSQALTILIRGANDFMLEEIGRSIEDAMSVVTRVFESSSVVPGGGAVEVAICNFLENLASRLESQEQSVVTEFADALLTIPKNLAVNATKDTTELLAKLRSYHFMSQKKDLRKTKPMFAHFGLDLDNGDVRDNLQAGVIEPSILKIKMIQFATEAVNTIMRIDGFIKLDKTKQPVA